MSQTLFVEFHCFIFIYPLVGIVEAAAVAATFNAEYTPINTPEAEPCDIVVPEAGTVPLPESNGIRRTYLASMEIVPPNVADIVIAPSAVEVVWLSPILLSWSIVNVPPLTLYVSFPALLVSAEIFCAVVIVKVSISLHHPFFYI